MKIIRYYQKQPIDFGCVRAIEDVLATALQWEIIKKKFNLYYPSETCTISNIDEVLEALKDRGKPNCIHAYFEAKEGKIVSLATCDQSTITIEVDGKDIKPDMILEAIEPIISLTTINEVPQQAAITSAFIAHSFVTQIAYPLGNSSK
jgi:hypothetical protein